MRMSLGFILLLLLHLPIVSHAAAIHDAAKTGDIAAITAALEAGVGVDESDAARHQRDQEQGRWNLSNLLRAPLRQPIDTIFNMMLR